MYQYKNKIHYNIRRKSNDHFARFCDVMLLVTILHLTKINHDIETNLMSDNTLFFQLIYLTAFMERQN
jgi:hypothetical protein